MEEAQKILEYMKVDPHERRVRKEVREVRLGTVLPVRIRPITTPRPRGAAESRIA